MISYAEVCLNVPIFENDTFTYQIIKPVQIGMRVLVEFNSRVEEGIVLKIHFNEPNYKTKEIKKVIDSFPIVTPKQIELAYFMKDFYLGALGECLHKMFPSGKLLKKKKEKKIEEKRDLYKLNLEQETAYNNIKKDFGTYSNHLLFGITGSGKTEVYIHLIHYLISTTKKNVLFLVPEIGLTFHTIKKLNEVFPNDVTILNSSMKISEKFYSYVQILENKKRILIGTRSAIFSPLSNIGLIIIDEEHDSSYKENSTPRYHSRQIAMKICKDSNAILLLGSATPSLEVFYHSLNGKIKIHYLKKRAVSKTLPQIHIEEKFYAKNNPIGSKLAFAIKQTLEKKEQVILFLNRRGYSPLLYNREEKENISCPNCTFSLCYHSSNKAICHLCGYNTDFETVNAYYNYKVELMGFGTQKIEEFILNEYPDAIIERLDQDAAKNKNRMSEVLSRLYDGKIDILIGTQMISKGLDSSKVSLVGVLNANIGLGLPDFRASERVFSLLTQVSGRAGRSGLKSDVIIQTPDKENPVLQLAAYQDYEKFFNYELHYRKSLHLPPFSRIVRFVSRSKKEELSEDVIMDVHKVLVEKNKDKNEILGPAPCPFYKIDNNYRNHIVIKTNSLNYWKEIIREFIIPLKIHSKAYLEIDFDPMDLL